MIDLDDPTVRKHVEQKARQRARDTASSSTRRGARETGVDGAPGQRLVNRWIKLDLDRPIEPTHDPWTLGDAFELEFEDASVSPGVVKVSLGAMKAANGGEWTKTGGRAWHCVTGWSARGVEFRGVSLDVALRTAFGANDEQNGRRRKYACLFQTSADGYTVGVDGRDVEGAFLAVTDGEGNMLSRDHGGPRLVFPHLYGWKSAKYLTKVELLDSYRDGFWEKLGCNRRGRWALEERWSESASRVWNVLAWLTSRYAVFGGERVWVWVMVRGGAFLGSIAATFTSLFNSSSANKY